MEQRYEMCEAYADSRGLKEGYVNIFFLEGQNYFYLGVECAPEDDEVLTWYFSPLGEHEALVFLYCGENTFDELVKNLDRTNSNAVGKAWPLFANALVNGYEDHYDLPALIKLNSVASVNGTFWCLAQKVENIDLTEFDDLLGEYAISKVKGLLSYCSEMLSQINENKLSTLDLVTGGIKEGIQWGKIAKTALSIGSLLLDFGDWGGD